MRTLCCVVLLGLGAPALAQEAASAPEGIDEVIVPGRAPENLRLEIERTEVAVYERFNALNSTDEFDIVCFDHTPTGSNIPERTCQPNFVIRAQARAAADIVLDVNGGGVAGNPAEHGARLEQKSRELTAELQRIAREDEQLARNLVRLAELKQLQASESGKERRARR
jgi:hypothetical protein